MHKTEYELRSSDWSADVCSSDVAHRGDDRHQNGQRDHFFDRVVEQADDLGGDKGCTQIDHQPGKAPARRVDHGLVEIVLADAGELEDVLLVQIVRASWRERVCQYG